MNDKDTELLTEAYNTVHDITIKNEIIDYLKENNLYKDDYANYNIEQLFELFQTEKDLISLNEYMRKKVLRRGFGRGFGRGLGRKNKYYRDGGGPYGRGLGPGRGLALCRRRSLKNKEDVE